jgi:predicted nucleic acid-binding protein
VLDEPSAAEVETLLRDESSPAVVTTVTEAETVDMLVRRGGATADLVADSLGLLRRGGLIVQPVDIELAHTAGFLRARHFDKRLRAVSMADCLALAAAVLAGDRLATADRALAQMAREEAVVLIALQDTRGGRPI